MKQFILILIIGLLSFSCGKKEGNSPGSVSTTDPSTPTTPTTPTVSPITESGDLQTLVQIFETTYSVTADYTVDFADQSYMNGGNSSVTVIGVCEVYSNGYKRVLVNQQWWNGSSATNDTKKVLVFHEMGHCQWRRAHDTRTFAGGRPYSIMYPMIDMVMPYYLGGFKDYYISEMDHPNAGAPTFKIQPLVTETPYTKEVSQTFDDGSCQTITN